MNVTQRINRILYIMSYVSQNQGVSVEELASRVGIRARQLLKELDFILLIGKPPFQPDDYVDIYVDEGRVYIEFDQMLNRPLRFTRAEAMALLMSLQLLDQEVDPETVHSLREKIQAAIEKSVDTTAFPTDQIAFERLAAPLSEHFAALRSAIEENRKIEIEYYSLTSDKTSGRVIRPYFLTKSLGYWYLTGFCELRQDIRTFKFERILKVVTSADVFEPPADLDLETYRKNFLRLFGKHQVEILFDPPVAPWIAEKWGSATRTHHDGGVVLSLSTETLEFPSRLVLSHAPFAHPLKPEELIDKIREDVQELVGIYQAAVS
jgi:proteasome accessory factor C